MQFSARLTALPLCLAAALALSACKSDEEKAQDFFQSSQALLAQGEEERALVELRNVFDYDPFHFEARKTYADILVKRGEIPEAYSQYLRLIEQYPDTPEVRLVLAELAIDGSNWEEAERHGREAVRLAPEDARAKVVGLALDYRAAVMAGDAEARTRLAEAARAALEAQPDSAIARSIVIDQLIAGPDPAQALPFIEQALAAEPASLDHHMMKFLLLNQLGRVDETGEQLKKMFELFPDNQEVRTSLIRWYMAKQDFEGAEAFLRKIAGEPTAEVGPHIGLLQFIEARRGSDAVRAELETLIAANQGTENGRIYSAMAASLDYDAGKVEEAVAKLKELVAGAEPTPEVIRVKGMLARILDQTGDRAGAETLVTEILTTDRVNAEALKLRAGWALAAERTPAAIQDLNDALTASPNDPEIFSLLAAAQMRDGNPESMGEYLGQAMRASGNAAVESLRYAAFLSDRGDLREAEGVLTGAWAVSPQNPDILRALANLFLTQKKWPQAQTAVDFLAKINPAEAELLRAALLDGQGKADEALALLRARIDRDEDVPATTQAALRILLDGGDAAGARALMDEVLSRNPQDRDLRLLSAGLTLQAGDADGAIATYRDLIAEKPDDEPPIRLLYGVFLNRGQLAEATAVLDAGLATLPEARTLLWLKAGEEERDGRIEEAIAIYDRLYAMDPSDILVANNLASLLASHRSDAESLARAEAISRRLRGSDNPALQDTYGWIAFLNGNTYGAIAALEPAARGLPDDALTQYHLGKLYQSMDRPADALAQYEKALALAEGSAVLQAMPQIADARAQSETIRAAMEAKPSP